MTDPEFDDTASLILAAEECDAEQFSALHRFSKSDEAIIRKLTAHGPILLRGGRGSGKSALMLAAYRRLWPTTSESRACGVYISLRHLELLTTKAEAYEHFFCTLLLRCLRQTPQLCDLQFESAPTVSSVQQTLSEISSRLERRLVLFFDDAAHIGRETSLADFFDIFRTISSSSVSCKAAIYPGVTRFGTRFDVFNDATVVEVARNDELPGFEEFFDEVMKARYSSSLSNEHFSTALSRLDVAGFLGKAVLGNMRSFVFACNELVQRTDTSSVGYNVLTDVLLQLAANHYWPLLDELRPKLGSYEPLVDPAKHLAEQLFDNCAKSDGRPYALVHRDITERLAKPFEMLEYVGFISRRDASRALKSGGRGPRFGLNLCNMLERMHGARLTSDLFSRWTTQKSDPVEFHTSGVLVNINTPSLKDDEAIEILSKPIETLAQSNAYPYGLTPAKINVLKEAGILTVRDLGEASDERLLGLPYVGEATVRRFRNVVGQAVWM